MRSTNLVHVKHVEEPEVGIPTGLKLEGAQGVRDVLTKLGKRGTKLEMEGNLRGRSKRR